MSHPFIVDSPQKHHALHFTHRLRIRELGFFDLVGFMRLLFQLFCNTIGSFAKILGRDRL